MTKSKSIRIALGTAVLALAMVVTGHAYIPHENTITFSRPIALPGVVLPAGSYVFDVAGQTALDVVVVRAKDSGKVFYMGFTNTVERPRNMSVGNPIAFGEAPANAPRPISTWYEIGNRTGHQFLYR